MEKVFIVGLPRTGTTSLCEFTLRHNIPTAHCVFNSIAFNEAVVMADAPIFADYAELAVRYPSAKFIINYRDRQQWLSSIKALLKTMAAGLFEAKPRFNPIVKRSFEQVLQPLTLATYQSEAHLLACYDRHYQHAEQQLLGRALSIDIESKTVASAIANWVGFEHDQQPIQCLNTRGMIDHWRRLDHPLKIKANKKSPLKFSTNSRQAMQQR